MSIWSAKDDTFLTLEAEKEIMKDGQIQPYWKY